MRNISNSLPSRDGAVMAMTGFGSTLFGGLRRMLSPPPEFVVGLIDAWTGDQYAIDGIPVVLTTSDPNRAIESLMRNRDSARYRPVILRNPSAEVPS